MNRYLGKPSLDVLPSLAPPIFANDDDDGGGGDDDEPVGLTRPVLDKGAVEAEVPVLSPVGVSHLHWAHHYCHHDEEEDYDC